MSNYENIRPYSELVHEAAVNGGPATFLKEFGNKYYDLGYLDGLNGKGKAIVTAVVATVGGTITLWEGGKWIYRKTTRRFEHKRALKMQEIKEAEEQALYILMEDKDNEVEE